MTLCPTRLGAKAIAFYAVLMATFFAIPYSNLFFLGMAFLSVIATANVLWALGNLRGVQASVTDIPPTPAGQPILVRFTITCTRKRVACLLSGSLHAGDQRCRTLPADLATSGVLTGELPPLPRGVYAITRAGVESPYPHGLVRAARRAEAARELIVFPTPLSLPSNRRTRRALIAEAGAGTADGNHGTASLRDWRPGDDPHRVHWKATARRGQLVVRQPDDDDTVGSEIVLDRRCAEPALEKALSTIVTLALLAEQSKERLALHTQGLSAKYGSGAASMHDLWRVLATLQPLPSGAATPPIATSGALRLPGGDPR